MNSRTGRRILIPAAPRTCSQPRGRWRSAAGSPRRRPAAPAGSGCARQRPARRRRSHNPRPVPAADGGKHPPGRFGERGKQVELQRRKPDRRAVGLYLTGIGIDGQAVEPQHGRAGLARAPVPPQHRLDPGGDLPRADPRANTLQEDSPGNSLARDAIGAWKALSRRHRREAAAGAEQMRRSLPRLRGPAGQLAARPGRCARRSDRRGSSMLRFRARRCALPERTGVPQPSQRPPH